MPEDQQLALLKELEEKLFKGRRKHTRKPSYMVVDYSHGDHFHEDHIQDISTGGVFIQTRMPFRTGQEVSLSFSLPDSQKHIKINGEVARVTPKGIGVKFTKVKQTEDQKAMIKSLLEQL